MIKIIEKGRFSSVVFEEINVYSIQFIGLFIEIKEI